MGRALQPQPQLFTTMGYHACHAREPVEPPNDARSTAAAFMDKMLISAWMAAARPMATRQAGYVNLTPKMFSLGDGVWGMVWREAPPFFPQFPPIPQT